MSEFGFRSIKGNLPLQSVDKNTTLQDLYEELPCFETRTRLNSYFPAPHEKDSVAELKKICAQGFGATFLRPHFLHKIHSLYETDFNNEKHGASALCKLPKEEIYAFLSKLKQSLFTEEELVWINRGLEYDENGAEVATAQLLSHLSEERISPSPAAEIDEKPISTPQSQGEKRDPVVPHQRFDTVFIRHFSKEGSHRTQRREYMTIVFSTLSNIDVPPTSTAKGHDNDGANLDKNHALIPPNLHQATGKHTIDAIADCTAQCDGTERKQFSGFQTAADALAEANARLGIKSTAKRQSLAKINYQPPFPRADQVTNDEGKNQSPRKKRAKSDEETAGLDHLPSYLLNEDGTALLPRVASCEPKLLETICREIMDLQTKVSWNDICGLQNAKKLIEEVVIWPVLRPELFRGLRFPPKGILLFGPPGTGKTLLARAVASQTRCTFFNISSSSLMSKWIGDGEKMVRCLFAIASVKQPSVVFIDEIDSLLSARAEGEQDAVRRIKTEFLVQLDGAATESTDRVLVIGATNRPEELDEAARRRLERRLYIPLPDAESRFHIVSRLMSSEANSLNTADITQIVELSAGYSGADMKVLCREAAMCPLRECRSVKSIAVDEVRPINAGDFAKALQTIRPTVSDMEIKRYADWNRTYGSAID